MSCGCMHLCSVTQIISCERQLPAVLWRKKTEEQSFLWLTALVTKYDWLKYVKLSLIVHVHLITMWNICHSVAKTTQCLPHHALFYQAHTQLSSFSSSAFLCFMIPLLTASHQTHKRLEVFGKALLNCAGRNVCAREMQWRDPTLWCLSWRTSDVKLLISFAQEWWAGNTISYT